METAADRACKRTAWLPAYVNPTTDTTSQIPT
jgi:hypothetical protein